MQTNNPHPQQSPEWQLFENAKSAELAAISFDADAERARLKAHQQRERAQAYWTALAKLAPDPETDNG